MMKSLNFNNLEIKILGRSQKGQDSILKYIFDTIGTTDNYYVEFGAVDGDTSCNTWYFKNYENWSGLLLDTSYENLSINLHSHHITKDNICELFQKYNVPQKFDFLCVDIDGNDYWVLSEILKQYNPNVIMIETNVRFNPDQSVVMKYNANWNWNGYDWYGASPLAVKNLCEKYNYSPVYLHLDDLILVNNSCLHADNINRNWLDIYPKSSVELYSDHIKPGHGPILEMDANNWITV